MEILAIVFAVLCASSAGIYFVRSVDQGKPWAMEWARAQMLSNLETMPRLLATDAAAIRAGAVAVDLTAANASDAESDAPSQLAA